MKENKKNKVMLIIVIIMSLVILTWNKSYSYEMNNSIPEEKEEIERKEFAIYLEKEQNSSKTESDYTKTETYPNKGYLLNTNKTKCYEYGSNNEVSNAVEQSISNGVIDGSIIVTSQKSIYCNIYFDKDDTPPEVSTFTLTGSSASSGTTLSNASKYTHTREVTYNVKWTNDDVVQICVSEGETCSNWQEVGSNSKTKNETITISTGDGPKNIYVYLKDKANNTSVEKSQIITLDITSPSITLSEKEVTEDTIVINVNASDKSGINNVTCKAEGNGTTKTVTYDNKNNICTFSDLKDGTEYKITGEAIDESGRKNTSNELSITTKQALSEGQTKAQEVLGVVPAGISNALLGDMYRFVGGCNAATGGCDTVVDNFICFGYDDPSDCVKKNDDGTINLDNDYIYRIIGITPEGQMKLIKNTILCESNTCSFYWSSSSSKVSWPNSTIFKRLNGTINGTRAGESGNTNIFVNANVGSTVQYLKEDSLWSNIIDKEHEWWYGTILWYNERVTNANLKAEWIYEIETGTRATGQSYGSMSQVWDPSQKRQAAIGLMYIHDFYYSYSASGIDSSETNCHDLSAGCLNSWLAVSNNGVKNSDTPEWIMTDAGLAEGGYFNSYMIRYAGYLGTAGPASAFFVRPVFYLRPSVTVTGGNGTSGNPFIIENEIEKENS